MPSKAMNPNWIIFFVFSLVNSLLANDEMILTNEDPKAGLEPIFTLNGTKFYENEKVIHQKYPSTIELAKHVMSQNKITLNLGKKTINIYPMKYVECIKNGKTKILGYFDRMSIDTSVIMIKYTNGESTVYGVKNSAIVKFTFSEKTSFAQLPSSLPDKSLFEVKLNFFSSNCESKRIAVVSEENTIGKYLASLSTANKEVDSKSKSMKDTDEILSDSNILLIENGKINFKLLNKLKRSASNQAEYKKIKSNNHFISENQLRDITAEYNLENHGDETKFDQIEDNKKEKMDKDQQIGNDQKDSNIQDGTSNENQMNEDQEESETSDSKKEGESVESKEKNVPASESNIINNENKEKKNNRKVHEKVEESNTAARDQIL